MRILMVTLPLCLDSLLKNPLDGGREALPLQVLPLPWLNVVLLVNLVEPLLSLPVLPLPLVPLPSLSEQSQCVV
jgi:hypothetical protein